MQDESARRSSLDERAYLTLRKMIIDGTLQPGEQLVQETLAERLGLSRTPLRKAVATLAQEGFAEITSRGAAFVRSFTGEELTSIWEIRAALEGLVSRNAARTAKPKHVAYLRSLITSAMEQVTPDDWSPYQEADREFHSYIAEIANAPLVIRILDAYQILSISLAQGYLRPPHETLPEHLDILDAIEQRDPERAERTMVLHIRTSMRYLERRSGDVGGNVLADRLKPSSKALAALAAAIDETVVVAHRDCDEAVVVAAREPATLLRVTARAGTRFPLHATAAGKVLLASTSVRGIVRPIPDADLPRYTDATIHEAEQLHIELDRIGSEGFAVDEEEFAAGVCGLAVPIEEGGVTIAALSVLVPAVRFRAGRERILLELRSTAAAIARQIALGSVGPGDPACEDLPEGQESADSSLQSE